ncbi:hypothetical protein HA402_011252 [Bradysia odoriphaga]|nr:hypothetical protein HA402_011252 [Bradysia odoriphaga]
MAFTRFVQSALSEREIRIFGGGEQVRDFTYIDDIVSANLLAADADTTPGEVVNVSGGSNISVNEVLDILEGIVGHELRVTRVQKADGDVARTGGASERAAELLGWRSAVTIEQGLERQLTWARDTSDVWMALPENMV